MPPRKRLKKEVQTSPRSPVYPPPGAPFEAVVGDENGDEQKNIGEIPAANDGPGRAPTPESMTFEEDEVSDDLGDALTEPAQSAGSRRGHNAAGGYNALKSFNGRVYSGMAIGGSHTWSYDQGQWKETKVEPDLWKVDFETTKRRARNAPKGSGAPVGTEYHWLVVAHQHVRKIDANTYETRLTGSKYKLAHKLASSKSWSVPTTKAQREREVELLEDAKRRVQGLPPVVASEKVRSTKEEKGQLKVDALFARANGTKGSESRDAKRKREVSGGSTL